MRNKILGFALFAAILPFPALAISESLLGTHKGGVIPKLIVSTKGDISAGKAAFSSHGISALDNLWDSREDVVTGACDQKQNDCRVFSIFRGSENKHPIVLLPGFTNFRRMFIEQVYDLMQAGYGPIYAPDFTGTGESYKPELKAGEATPNIEKFLQENASDELTQKFNDAILKGAAAENPALIRDVVLKLPVGIGYIENYNDYEKDIELVMDRAIAENPNTPIVITSLSASGLSVFLALAHQAKKPTWIKHVDRILLESPMVRVTSTDHFFPGFGMLTQILTMIGKGVSGAIKVVDAKASIPEYVGKALGYFNPDNVITHSENRLTLIDSIRVWNGHETAGATFGWAWEELRHQYSRQPFDTVPFAADPLNFKSAAITKALNENNVKLVVVASEADVIVDTSSTRLFLRDLVRAGTKDLTLCTFQTAKHVIDQESDKYRDPFMQVVYDLKNRVTKPSYGLAPENEVLPCAKVEKR